MARGEKRELGVGGGYIYSSRCGLFRRPRNKQNESSCLCAPITRSLYRGKYSLSVENKTEVKVRVVNGACWGLTGEEETIKGRMAKGREREREGAREKGGKKGTTDDSRSKGKNEPEDK